MATIISFLNSRESSMPYQTQNEAGEPTFARKYQATLQYMVEGPTRDCLNFNSAIPSTALTAVGAGSLPPEFANIPIDPENSFSPLADFHAGSVSDRLLYSYSEITWNYDKVSQYGKMVGTFTLDINGPVEVYNRDTGNWDITDPVEY